MQEIDPNINPWITMWSQPQKTIRAVINIDPNMGFFFLASIWFLQFFFLFESYYSLSLPIHWALTIVVAVIISPFVGALCFYSIGALLYIIGKLMKGKATFAHTRCAFAWSRIPVIIDLIMWFTISFFISELIFARVGVDMSFIFINLIACITSIWSFVLLVGVVKEIQKFSLFKALLNVIIVYLLLSLIISIISSLVIAIKLN